MYGKLQQVLRDVNDSPYTTFMVNIFPGMDADECANVDSKGSADSHDQRVLKETEDDMIKNMCRCLCQNLHRFTHGKWADKLLLKFVETLILCLVIGLPGERLPKERACHLETIIHREMEENRRKITKRKRSRSPSTSISESAEFVEGSKVWEALEYFLWDTNKGHLGGKSRFCDTLPHLVWDGLLRNKEFRHLRKKYKF